jgi:hypothetical protein
VTISEERAWAIATVRAFLDGSGGVWDWDDFISVRAVDPEVRKLQGLCLALPDDYPPARSQEYCNEEGFARLRSAASDLETGEKTG